MDLGFSRAFKPGKLGGAIRKFGTSITIFISNSNSQLRKVQTKETHHHLEISDKILKRCELEGDDAHAGQFLRAARDGGVSKVSDLPNQQPAFPDSVCLAFGG